MPARKFIAVSASILLLSGCASLVPHEQKQSEAVKSSEDIAAAHDLTLKRTLEVVPEMATRIAQWGTGVVSTNLVLVSPPHIRETIDLHDTSDTSAGATAAARGSTSLSIPLGVKLALLGIGGFIVLAFLWALRRSSAAANAVFEAGDRGFAQLANHLGAVAASSTAPEHLNLVNALRAEVEKVRGKFHGETK